MGAKGWSKPCLAVLAATAGLTGTGAPAGAQIASTTQATLLDRIQIEDLITDYYNNLGTGGSRSFGDYYVDGAEFDVNGTVVHGREGIEGLYRSLSQDSPARHGTFHMLLNNPLVRVTGDTATAEFLWTGIINDTVTAPPRLVEQGREYDLLVKRNGSWRIRKRVIIADSGLPAMFEKTYTPRRDYDPAKNPPADAGAPAGRGRP